MAMYKKYKTKKGVFWEFRTYLGSDEITGKEFRATRRGFKTKKECQLACRKLHLDYEQNGFENSSKIITFQQLYELWLSQYRLSVKPSSIALAQRFCKNHILPVFGKLKLNKITVAFCQKQVNIWHGKYKQYAYLRKQTAQIFKFGIAMEIMDSNPMSKTLIQRKKEEEKVDNFYDKEELKQFFDCLTNFGNKKQFTFFRLLAFTGCRKSELLAAQWHDIDFTEKKLTIGKTLATDEFGKIVIQTPKTKSSERTLELDNKTFEILSKWRMKQREDYFKLGYNTNSEEQFVFTNNRNELYYPQVVNDWLKYLIQKYQLKKITPHGFRHTCASLLFEAGATVPEVQQQLGHKTSDVTLEIYTHVTNTGKKNTSDKLAKYCNF